MPQISALLVCLLLIQSFWERSAWAGSGIALLGFFERETAVEDTERFADRLREEFHRRFHEAVLTKEETEGLFFYHKEGVLNDQRGGRGEEKQLEEAKRAYFELRFPEAERILETFLKEQGSGERVEGYLLLGLTELGSSDEPAATQSFREALRLDPDRRLDPAFFPPKTVRFFDKVRSEAKFPTAKLIVQGDPEGAEVLLNGVIKGLTPLVLLKVPIGNHQVTVRSDHYVSFERKLTLRAGAEEKISVKLAWKPSSGERKISGQRLGFSVEEIGGIDRATPVTAALGKEMGVSKVLLISLRKSEGLDQVETRLVDVELRSAHKKQTTHVSHIEGRSAVVAAQMADDLTPQIRGELKTNPEKFADNRYEGEMILIGHPRRAIYRKPLFWILLGAAGTGGGLALSLLGGAAATTGTLGVVFQ